MHEHCGQRTHLNAESVPELAGQGIKKEIRISRQGVVQKDHGGPAKMSTQQE